MGLCSEGRGRGLNLGEKTLQFEICLTYYFPFFLHYKARRTRRETCSKLTIKTPWRRSVSLLLVLNTFHFLLQFFSCWVWSFDCRLGLLLVFLMVCACCNQFRWRFLLRRNLGAYTRGLIFGMSVGLHIWGTYIPGRGLIYWGAY